MTKKGNIWIVPHKGGWAVKREKAQRSIVVTDTKAEAEEKGRQVGKKQQSKRYYSTQRRNNPKP